MAMEDIDRLWFLPCRETPERDQVESIAEITERIIAMRNRRRQFIENARPEFYAPSITNEATELVQVFILEEGECAKEKMKVDEVFAQKVRDELADILIFSFDFAYILNIDFSTEIYKVLGISDTDINDQDMNFQTLKELANKRELDPLLNIPINLAAEIAVTSSRMYRDIAYLEMELKNSGSDKTVTEALIEDEEIYSKIKEIFAEVILLTIQLANMLDIDITEAIEAKMVKVKAKVPEDI